jgi:hypothetical protein
MRAEKPIIATNISSHTQVLDATCSYLGEPTSAGLALAMKECFAALPGDREERVREAKKLVDAKFNKDDFRNILKNLYEAL